MDKVPTNWKLHFWWGAVVSALLLLSIATYWLGGKGSEMASHVMFASSVASILLAVIVIIYTFYQSNRSEQNISEMRTLVGQANEVMRKTTDTMSQKADVLEQQAVSVEESLVTMKGMFERDAVTETARAPLPNGTFKFDASALPPLSLLSLYCLVKAHETGKILNCLGIAKAIVALKEYRPREIDLVMNGGVILSTVYAFRSFFGTESIERRQNGFKVHNLPKGLREYIEVNISKRIEGLPDRNEHRQLLETGPTAIDAHFESL